jgi:hypothetical protein
MLPGALMSYEYLYGLNQPVLQEPLYHERFKSRKEELQSLKRRVSFDVAIVGGGITAITLARMSAFHGFKTILLCNDDFGMPRGTPLFRPLLLPALENTPLLEQADHLSSTRLCKICETPTKTLLHLPSFFRKKVEEEELTLYSIQRLAIDILVSGRREGAIFLNFVKTNSFQTDEEGTISLEFADRKTEDRYQVSAGIIFNLSENATLGRVLPRQLKSSKGYFLRIDLLREQRTEIDNKLFRLQNEIVTSIQTAEGEILSAALNLPFTAPASLILERIKHITSSSDLNLYENELLRADRTLIPFSKRKLDARLWTLERNVLTVTAESLFRAEALGLGALYRACKEANLPKTLVSLQKRRLPGSLSESNKESLAELFAAKGLKPEQIQELIALFGRRAEELLESESLLENVTPNLLAGSLLHAYRCELAATSEDVCMRRLFVDSGGIDVLEKAETCF